MFRQTLATAGFYYNEATGFGTLPADIPPLDASCQGIARATSLTTNAASADAVLNVYADLPFGVKFGGRVSGFLGFLSGNDALGDLQFGTISVGPQAHVHWDSDAQVAFAKDTGSVIGLEVFAAANLKSPQLNTFFKALSGGLVTPPSISLAFPTIPIARALPIGRTSVGHPSRRVHQRGPTTQRRERRDPSRSG